MLCNTLHVLTYIYLYVFAYIYTCHTYVIMYITRFHT